MHLIPSLLPFMILSNYLILRGTLFTHVKPRIYCLLVGHLCGYPMGARTTGELLRQNYLTQQEAEQLMAGCNLPSPAFIIAFTMTETLHAPAFILPGLVLLYAANYAVYRMYGAWHKLPPHAATGKVPQPRLRSRIQSLDQAIVDGFATMNRICGYLILCSILLAVLSKLFSLWGTGDPLFLSLIEMTNGVKLIAASSLPDSSRVTLALSCISFGGLCTIAQIKGMLLGTSLSVKSCILFQCIHAALTYILCRLFFILIQFFI
ncbi:MAG: hypothetical protein PHS82_12005 [Lachnospiraceae bacterium]|nr:hypothetical protein [Lachnospiraceae bacterium]